MASNPSTEHHEVAEILARELDEGCIEVPLLPNVASEVLSSTLDDRSNAQRLAGLIEGDQSLASHILRVVNSPAFRGSAEIVALKQAIARLGMERIREIALTISLKGTLFAPGPHEAVVELAWQTGLRTGLWAKEIARTGRKNVETAYLCGLLHNVGVPILVNRACALDKEISADDVNAIVAQFATRAGILLVNEWRLPEVVGHSIAALGGDTHEQAADAVMVLRAAKIVTDMQLNDCLEQEDLVVAEPFQELNFYPDDLEALVEHADTIDSVVKEMA